MIGLEHYLTVALFVIGAFLCAAPQAKSDVVFEGVVHNCFPKPSDQSLDQATATARLLKFSLSVLPISVGASVSKEEDQ